MNGVRKCDFLNPDGFNELALCRDGPLIYNKHDIYVGGSIAKYGEFSRSETLLFEQIVRSGQIVVEVGANIGAHTVDLARMVGPTGVVYAFEPQRLVFQTLCGNLALNQLANVHALQAGVGAAAGSISVPLLNYSERHNFGGVSLGSYPDGEHVPLTTIDMQDLPNCHFIKVDVEGMEAEVLKGARGTIDNYRPFLYVENDRKDRSHDLLELIDGLGYDAYWHLAAVFNPSNFAGDPVNHFVEGLVSINVFCSPRENNLVVNGLRKVVAFDETP